MRGKGEFLMTAEEVKNSLENCSNKYCKGCAFSQSHIATCTAQLAVEALILITEQEKKITDTFKEFLENIEYFLFQQKIPRRKTSGFFYIYAFVTLRA